MTRKDDTTPAPSNPKSAISNQQSAITVHQLPPSAIAPTPDNPRTINEKSPEFLELVASVKAVGVNVPVACRPDGDGHILIYGERRLRAARLAGRETIPALVYDGLTPEQAFELTFAENYQREDLTPMEECKAVQLLSAKYGGDTRAVAAKLGRSERWVQQRAKLDNLSDLWREALAERPLEASALSAGHLAVIARLDPDLQATAVSPSHILEIIFEDSFTVADLEKYINGEILRRLDSAPWDLDDATIDTKAGACSACPKRASCQGMLFLEEADDDARRKNDQCTDPACWDHKAAAHLQRQVTTLRAEHGEALQLVATDHPDWKEARDLKKALGPYLELYQFKPCKTGAAGARPAFVIHGPNAGDLIHITLGTGAGSRSATGAAKTPGTPTPLKLRRKALDSKRRAETLRLLAEKIGAMACPLHKNISLEYHALMLAAAFGTRDHACIFKTDFGDPWARLEGYYASGQKYALQPAEDLWRNVRPVLVGLFAYNGPITQTLNHLFEAGARVAALCDIDFEALYEDACATYKEPKSWAGLKADGTPKTTGAAKGATKDTKTGDGKAGKKKPAKKRKSAEAPKGEGGKADATARKAPAKKRAKKRKTSPLATAAARQDEAADN